MSLKRYKKTKADILKELGITLTPEETAHMDELRNEIQVDQFARTLILGSGPALSRRDSL